MNPRLLPDPPAPCLSRLISARHNSHSPLNASFPVAWNCTTSRRRDLPNHATDAGLKLGLETTLAESIRRRLALQVKDVDPPTSMVRIFTLASTGGRLPNFKQ